MKDIKKIFFYIFRILWATAPLIIIGFIAYDYIYIDQCHDNGGVWDSEEKRCRDDCYTWQKEYGGCIKMTPEQIACVRKRTAIFCFDTQQMYILCKYNNKAWNNSANSCRYEFTPQECHKLSGSWEYPDICNK